MEPEYLHFRPEQPLPEFASRPHRTIIIAEEPVSEAWRNRIAAWLVRCGCLYVIAWGVDCEAWHDSADWANREAFNFSDIPDDHLVMTTWHDDEPLSEALWFAGNCAVHPEIELSETIIIHVSREERRSGILQSYHDSQKLAEDG
ncbi:hypothetical protein XI09_06835 [Bradyrhizobium sp. CCBAU 11386]|uniref:DUF7684 family protein n=1 Tax=Bradyrhizobium sp. CCBAU 11386 TaxID=1630837 RepID=UPI002302EEEB|nr:hypothetical protein [Bradyrhizobium sp. CCBAU 11386]MDA9504467.1 hypothetical protein [Bradyrhizobium sp. CCBAU 11386]